MQKSLEPRARILSRIIEEKINEITVQRFFASFLRLGLENVEYCSANEEVGERADDQR